MRLLFVHQNFPGQYRHLAPHLAARGGHEITGLGEKANVLRQKPVLPGVKLLGYTGPQLPASAVNPLTASVQQAVHRGRVVARGAEKLRRTGYRPDLVLAHIGWGEAIFLKDVFPEARLLLYCEFFYRPKGSDFGFDPEFAPSPDRALRLRVMNAPLLMALEACDWGVAPTAWQQRQFPPAYAARISRIHDGIDTDLVTPDANARFRLPGDGATLARADEVITYVSRNLEPYRGFHIFMRALPELLRRRPRARVVIVGADEVSYSPRLPAGQSYRKRLLAELEGRIDWSRVHMIPWLPYPEFISLLRVSSAHVYLTYPFVASWSLMEAMSAGCLVIASRTAPVEELIVDGENGLLTDFFDPAAIAARVDEALRAGDAMTPLRERARQTIVENYDLRRICLPAQVRLIEQIVSGGVPSPGAGV